MWTVIILGFLIFQKTNWNTNWRFLHLDLIHAVFSTSHNCHSLRSLLFLQSCVNVSTCCLMWYTLPILYLMYSRFLKYIVIEIEHRKGCLYFVSFLVFQKATWKTSWRFLNLGFVQVYRKPYILLISHNCNFLQDSFVAWILCQYVCIFV